MNKVAAIIPCLNGAKYLRQCLDSVMAQDYAGPMEVVVADDGSTDVSPAIASEYAPRVRWLPCPRDAVHGCGAARNRAIQATTAKYVALLDADDIWFPGHITALVDVMDAHQEIAFACDNGRYIDQADHVYGSIVSEGRDTELNPTSMLLDCFTDQLPSLSGGPLWRQSGALHRRPDFYTWRTTIYGSSS